MANIDYKSIPGYEDMSPEEKVAALEAYSIPEPDYSGYVKKSVFDETASALSKLKKQHSEKLSEEERKAEEQKNMMDSLQQEVNALRQEKMIGEYKAGYLALGYSEDLAASSAKAKAEGDTKTEFANYKSFLEQHDKDVLAQAMRSGSTPPAGSENINNYQSLVSDALARGDSVAAAAYMRQAQERLN